MRWSDRDSGASRKRSTVPLLIAAAGGMLLGFAGSLYAALPPIYQTWREFGMVIAEAEIPRILSAQGQVERIERIGDSYRVWAGHCYVPVAMVPIERDPKTPPIIGPIQIRAEIRPMQCR